ncbi:MAG: hypothetical protein M1822_000040 [Bathelium mastoideum]|nr:MAG: hypothetical protein M1822_000040 [Bathelium mastoideum]
MATLESNLAEGDPRRASSAGYGSGESNSSRSPLGLGFLKNLTSGQKTTRDGQPPKRRGPKPDSKPALTRRQELNRQAQRTHRERKEMYIKALEQEVLRLKEVFSSTARERDAFAEENRKLRELLAANGIQFDLSSPAAAPRLASSYGGSSSGSISGSYPPGSAGFSPTPPGRIQGQGQRAPVSQQNLAQIPQGGLDYDQLGIDFVLTLERPCMDHMQFLCVRSDESLQNPPPVNDDQSLDADVHISGHALMATCPPASHIAAHPQNPYPHKMPDLGVPDLMKLLDLSNRLPLDGEITPIMAWTIVRGHARVAELTQKDIEAIRTDLLAKVRCYGFGAVLEEFEVRDALSNVLATKGYQ